MRTPFVAILAAALMSPVAAPRGATAEVVVGFERPGRFTDADLFGRRRSDRTDTAALIALRRNLERLGERFLAPNETLRIDVLDLDLAGWINPGQLPSANEARTLDPAHWPSLRLRYRLERDGQVVARSTETLADRTYLSRPEARFSADPLRHEQAMIEDWFRERFADPSRRG